MYARDPVILRRPARRLNAIVRVSNALLLGFWVYAFLLLLLLYVVPKDIVRSIAPALFTLSLAYAVLAIITAPFWCAIRFGFIKCPCCGSRYDSRVFAFTLERKCGNCGFDVSSCSRQGDF
jgi:hypothetical protein